MSLDEFVAKYNGQKVDFDNSLGAQCVDLYRFYLKEVLNMQTPPVAGAYQLFDTWPYEKIKNTPSGLPQKGDIMIWDQSYGGFGHVGIVISADLVKFQAFEQNDPIGSPCQIKTYSYAKTTGWLRPNLSQIITQLYKGEKRIVLRSDSEQTWESLCKVYGIDPNIINENI